MRRILSSSWARSFSSAAWAWRMFAYVVAFFGREQEECWPSTKVWNFLNLESHMVGCFCSPFSESARKSWSIESHRESVADSRQFSAVFSLYWCTSRVGCFVRMPVIRWGDFLVKNPEAPNDGSGARDHGSKSTSDVKTAGEIPSDLQRARAPHLPRSESGISVTSESR